MKKKKNIIIALGCAIVLGATAFGIHFANKPSLPKTYAELTALTGHNAEVELIATRLVARDV